MIPVERSDLKLIPFPELDQVLNDLVTSLKAVLDEALVGVYLQGSFAVGDFDEHSDVDFIVVVSRVLSDAEVSELNDMHSRIYSSGPEWAKHLEGSYFTPEQLSSPPGAPVRYLDHGSYSLEMSDHCNTLVVRSVMQTCGVALLGPPAAELVPPVAKEALREEIGNTMRSWGREILAEPDKYRNRFYQGYIVLSYCRMLCDLESGTIGSKKRGAEWAKKKLPAEWHDLIEAAWLCRPDPATSVRTPANDEQFQKTLAFVEHCLTRLHSAGL